ncbi:MAG: hypothetical protein ABIG39_00750 [Candidatus Micrarchaeota archaeon]
MNKQLRKTGSGRVRDGTRALERKTSGPAEISLQMFTRLDMSKIRVRKKVGELLEKAERGKMKNAEFVASLKTTDLTEDEKKFAVVYYTLYRTSFRKEDREPASTFIGYNREEPLSKLNENGYYSFANFFFDENKKPVAMISGAFIEGEKESENVLFIGYRAVAKGSLRLKGLSNELLQHAIDRVRKETGSEIGYYVGEFDRPQDLADNKREHAQAISRLDWAGSEGRVAIEGLRWPQPVYDYDEGWVKPPQEQENLLLLVKEVGENRLETKKDVETLVRTVFQYYGLDEAKILGTDEIAMERYVKYAMENVPEKPGKLTPESQK